jgi:hypothetical protein
MYISDNKLDMLFEQIDQGVLKHISAEVKVDLKLAGVTLRQTEQPTQARTAKLRVVERFIEKYHHVGTIQEPGNEYFRGQMDMQWGWLPGANPPNRLPIVVFRGSQSSQFVVLAGSRRHVLEERMAGAGEDAVVGLSLLPNIYAAIAEHISEAPEFAEQVRARPASEIGNLSRYALDTFAKTSLETPTQPLEFLAVPLVESQIDYEGLAGIHGVLGTPLYVARWSRP